MSQIGLGLVVLRAADLPHSVAFYRALGLVLAEEQHGNGPVHYACALGNTIVEIYPGKPGTAPERQQGGATMLGFHIESLDDALHAVTALGAAILTKPAATPWGRRAVVQDPDGRAIDLTEPNASNEEG